MSEKKFWSSQCRVKSFNPLCPCTMYIVHVKRVEKTIFFGNLFKLNTYTSLSLTFLKSVQYKAKCECKFGWTILWGNFVQVSVISWFQCLKKLLRVPMGSQIRHPPRKPSPNVLACLKLKLTQGHPLVAKFSNVCHFRHFLRVPRKTWPKSTGLP